jgi:hydroxymethylpyrimidine/phosphomethylpyrimidine kinase
MKMPLRGRVLIVAGSDSGGGAGIQADIKTVTALGGYAATAITAITVQNTLGVHGIFEIPAEIVARQMRAVLDDIGADALKSGMLSNIGIIEAVADVIKNSESAVPYVLDPVMAAKGGAPLVGKDAIAALRRHLLPLAAMITPNLPEAELLCGFAIQSSDDMRRAGERLAADFDTAVLVKGGHLPGEVIHDVLVHAGGTQIMSMNRLESVHTHGTGCTLASAIATFLAQGESIENSVTQARHYVREAILNAPGFGKGHGPLGHGFTKWKSN